MSFIRWFIRSDMPLIMACWLVGVVVLYTLVWIAYIQISAHIDQAFFLSVTGFFVDLIDTGFYELARRFA